MSTDVPTPGGAVSSHPDDAPVPPAVPLRAGLLTPEQFSALVSIGYSPEQVTKFEAEQTSAASGAMH